MFLSYRQPLDMPDEFQSEPTDSRNSLHDIPDEILSEILLHSFELHRRYLELREALDQTSNQRLVCRRWDKVLLSTPQLWSTIEQSSALDLPGLVQQILFGLGRR